MVFYFYVAKCVVFFLSLTLVQAVGTTWKVETRKYF